MKQLFGSKTVSDTSEAVKGFFSQRRAAAAAAAERAQGFHESSFDLRTGLEVSEQPLAELPDEFKRHFAHQRVR